MQEISYNFIIRPNAFFPESSHHKDSDNLEDNPAVDTTLDTTTTSEGEIVITGEYLKEYAHLKTNPDIRTLITASAIKTINHSLSTKTQLQATTSLSFTEAENDDTQHLNNSHLSIESTESSEESLIAPPHYRFGCESQLADNGQVVAHLIIEGIWRSTQNWQIVSIRTDNADFASRYGAERPQSSISMPQSSFVLFENGATRKALEFTAASTLPLLAGFAILAVVAFLSLGTTWLILGLIVAGLVIGNACYQMHACQKHLDLQF